MSKLKEIYFGSKVLITGHTGFKGSWLSIWLNDLGAEVYGISNELPSKVNHFEEAKLYKYVNDYRFDVRNYKNIYEFITKVRPDFIFHLAAQPIVSESYKDPLKTYETNLLGTISILEAIRVSGIVTTAVFITSDKCYENLEWPWGYKETDKLGGSDPYSSSKACAEIAISSYYRSYFSKDKNVKIGIGRAGNVIGGGDWAPNRIVPDCIKSWNNNLQPILRNPKSTRPWQHVLEPLSGYLYLGLLLNSEPELNGEPFNFGPISDSSHSVEKLVECLSKYWPDAKLGKIQKKCNNYKESNLLKLNCDKALFFMNWKPTLDFNETVQFTADWYFQFYKNKNLDSVYELSSSQIKSYTSKAKLKGYDWIV